MSTFYITTPIYYVNDRPHIGHCYTTLLADVMARFQRLVRGGGQDVFFLTGTDEHADKVVTSAAEHGATPQAWADRNAEEFKKAFAFINATNDDFIRTTEARHKEKVPVYIKRLMDSGDIYKGQFTGWYDEGQEEYVAENTARERDFKGAISGKPLVKRTEDCYFFKLGKYWDKLREMTQRDEWVVRPEPRRAEVLGRLIHEEARDVPISRPVTDDPATQWGIRIPGDPAHRVYVWIDALFNYLTVVDTPERRKYWPAQVHLLGKDILWFHAVIWPCLLMALGEKLPAMVFGHGWWISEGQKMSKSLGNFIDLERMQAYANRYGVDALRWYLATQGPLGGTDSDFSHAKFVEVYNADLANGIGNCASRVGNMIEKYFGGKCPPFEAFERSTGIVSSFWRQLVSDVEGVLRETHDGNFRPDIPGQGMMRIVREVDQFINWHKPFEIAKRIERVPEQAKMHTENLEGVLYACAEALRVASILASPIIPQKMAQLWKTWNCEPPAGVSLAELAEFGGKHALKPGQSIAKGEALFMRADIKEPAPVS